MDTQQLHRYLLAFGSNLGDRQTNCQQALALMAAHFTLLKTSPWEYTAPLRSAQHETRDHEEYLNFVVDGLSHLGPQELYQEIVSIENLIGHRREQRWLPRHLDIDILLWADNSHQEFAQCQPRRFLGTNALLVPHAQLHKREFLCKALATTFNLTFEMTSANFSLCSTKLLSLNKG